MCRVIFFHYHQITQSIEDIAVGHQQQQQHESLARKRSTSHGSILNVIRCNGRESDVIQPERGRLTERRSSSSSSHLGERRSLSLDSFRTANRDTLEADGYDNGPDSDDSSSSTEIKSTDETATAAAFADDSSLNVFDGDDSSVRSATDSEINDAAEGNKGCGCERADATAAQQVTWRVTRRRPPASFREAMTDDLDGGLAMRGVVELRGGPAASDQVAASSASTTGADAVGLQLPVASVGDEDGTMLRGSADMVSDSTAVSSWNGKRSSGTEIAVGKTIPTVATPSEEGPVRSSSSVAILRGLPVSARVVMLKEANACGRRGLEPFEVEPSCKPANVEAKATAGAPSERAADNNPAEHHHYIHRHHHQQEEEHRPEDVDADADGLYPGWPQNYVYQLARAFSYRAKKTGPARKPLQNVFVGTGIGGGVPSHGPLPGNRPATAVFDAEIKRPVPEEVGDDVDERKSDVDLGGESTNRSRLASTADEKQPDVVCGVSVRETVRLLNMQASKSFELPHSKNLADATAAHKEPLETAASVSYSIASPGVMESSTCIRPTTARSTSIGRHTRTAAAALIQERMKVFEKIDSS